MNAVLFENLDNLIAQTQWENQQATSKQIAEFRNENEKQREKLEMEKRELEQQIRTQVTENQSQREKLEMEKRELEQQIHAKTSWLRALKEKFENEKRELEQKINTQETGRSVLSEEFRKEREEWSLQRDLLKAASKEQFKLLSSQLSEIHSSLVHTHAKLERMRQTRSWRWTEPLRCIERRLRKFSPCNMVKNGLYEIFARIRMVWFFLGKPCPRAAKIIRNKVFNFLPKKNPTRKSHNSNTSQASDITTPKTPCPQQQSNPNSIPKETTQKMKVDTRHAITIASDISTVVFCQNGNDPLRTLQDIIGQSLPAEQILVATPKHTPDIIRAVNSFTPPIRMLYSPLNTRKEAIYYTAQLVSSKLMAAFCASDKITPNLLQKGNAALQQNTSAHAVYLTEKMATLSVQDALSTHLPVLIRKSGIMNFCDIKTNDAITSRNSVEHTK